MTSPSPSSSLADRIAATRLELRRARLQAAQAVESAERLAAERQTALSRQRAVHEGHLIARGRSSVVGPVMLVRHPRSRGGTRRRGRHAPGLAKWTRSSIARASRPHRCAPHRRRTCAPIVLTLMRRCEWLRPGDVAGIVREGLCAPDVHGEWTLEARPARSLLRTARWRRGGVAHPRGVLFEISAKSDNWSAEVKRLLHPRT